MQRKVSAIVGVLAFFLAAFAVRQGFEWFRREPAVSSKIMTRPWVEQVLVPGAVSLDAPWPLDRQEVPMPPEVNKVVTRAVHLGKEADGLNVMASAISFLPDTPTSLDGAADGAFANVRTLPGVKSVVGNKRETIVLGVRAIELDGQVERTQGAPLQLHGIVAFRGDALLQALLIARSDQPLALEAWERVRGSIRSTTAN